MSVHDVAAVDRVGSLRRTPAPASRTSSLRVSSNVSLPTSPTRGAKPDTDTLRRAMARHQVRFVNQMKSLNMMMMMMKASLSRPESPKCLNDDLPQNRRNMIRDGYNQNPVVRRRERLEEEYF